MTPQYHLWPSGDKFEIRGPDCRNNTQTIAIVTYEEARRILEAIGNSRVAGIREAQAAVRKALGLSFVP